MASESSFLTFAVMFLLCCRMLLGQLVPFFGGWGSFGEHTVHTFQWPTVSLGVPQIGGMGFRWRSQSLERYCQICGARARSTTDI